MVVRRSAMVLVTRPEPGAGETAAALRACGHVPIVAPVLHIEPQIVAAPRNVAAIAVTSGQAVAGLPSALQALPLFAVGDASAARARAAGFRHVESAAGTAQDLARLMVHRLAPGAAVLLASGAGNGLDLADDLRAAGLRVSRRVAYRSVAAETLEMAAVAALEANEVDFVLIFSPASARRFVALAQAARVEPGLRRVIAIAISPAAAVPLAVLPLRAVLIAMAPDQKHMLALLS
ncbi:uroporphyrinogen-III synthase [Acidiphilium sp. MT5]